MKYLKQHLLSLVLVSVLLPLPLSAAQTLVIKKLGNTTVRIPAPVGYTDPSEDSHTIARMARMFTPPSNLSVAFFMDRADIKNILAGKGEMRRYMMVQSYRSTEYKVISREEFKRFKEVLVSQQDALSKWATADANRHLQNVKGEMNRITKSKVSVKIGEMVPLGVYHEDSHSIAMAIYTKVATNKNNKKSDRDMIIGATTALVKGKLMFLYVYSEYNSESDLAWAKAKSLSWLKRVKQANR